MVVLIIILVGVVFMRLVRICKLGAIKEKYLTVMTLSIAKAIRIYIAMLIAMGWCSLMEIYWQLHLAELIPVIGICRKMQELN